MRGVPAQHREGVRAALRQALGFGNIPSAVAIRIEHLALVAVPLAQATARSLGAVDARALVLLTTPDSHLPAHLYLLQQLFGLTAVESQVALALVSGCSARECAAKWDVSIATIRTHLGNMRRKLNVESTQQLVAELAKHWPLVLP